MSNSYRASKEEIVELRKMVPVGVMDAKRLLEQAQGEFVEARKLYLEEEIKRLAQLTGLDEVKVGQFFFENDYSTQATIDAIRDFQFKVAFSKAAVKAQAKDFPVFDEWIEIVKHEGLMKSLQLTNFDSVFTVIYDTGFIDFAEALIEAHIFLHNKEITLRGVGDDELIEAVADLKQDDIYKKAVEQYKITVLLDPEFLKVIERLRKEIED